MRLKFYKENETNYVKILTKEEQEIDFDYVEMIRHIFNDKGIEEPLITDEYLDEEKESINNLIKEISENLISLFNDEIIEGIEEKNKNKIE